MIFSPEQAEIVCILDAISNKELQAKEAAEAVLSQIDTMKKRFKPVRSVVSWGRMTQRRNGRGNWGEHIYRSNWDK